MDPNEIMGSDPIIDPPVPEAEEAADTHPEAPQPQADSGTYRNVGAGQKESPFADSPYYTVRETRDTDYAGPAWDQAPPKPPKQKKPRKKMGSRGRRVLTAMLALVLVAGSCGVTAALVNSRWEKEVDALQQDMQSQIDALRDQVGKASSIGSVSSFPVAADGALTPSQVYAMNVNSVVSIGNYATVSTGWGGYSQQMVSSGSGFILSEDGYVVSNYHVVEGAERLTVTTYLGDEYEASMVGYDQLNDVALLKVEAAGLDAVTIGSSDALNVGDQVVAIGNPLGELTSTQTVGYVSGKDRAVSTDGSIINMLQTDAAINSGNSGGPLFNIKGEVVGITTAKYSGDSGSGASIEGIGFAIPIDDVMGMMEDFKQYGYLRNQAYLGVTVSDMDTSVAQRYSLPSGSFVETVTEGGSADKAGVQVKDIIIGLGEYEVGSNAELTSALRRFKAGDTTTITVFRAGQEIELTITFDEKPQDTTPATEETLPSSGQYPEDAYGYGDEYGNGYPDIFDFFPFG